MLVLALTLILLPAAIFMLVRLGRPIVDGADVTVVAVAHVEWHGTERRQIAVFALRDGAYIKNDERVGFLGLSSVCKQYKGDLPSELSLARVRSIVEAPGFQKLVGNSGARHQGWYVRTHVGPQSKCMALSEEEASRYDFIPLVTWFRAVEASNPAQVRDCSNEGSDYIDHWCEERKQTPMPGSWR